MTEKTSYYLKEVLDIATIIKETYLDLAKKDKNYHNYIRKSYYDLLKELKGLTLKEDDLYYNLPYKREDVYRIILELKEEYRKNHDLTLLRIINKLKEKDCIYYPIRKNKYLLELQLDIDTHISYLLDILLQNCNDIYYPEIRDKKYELIMTNPLLEETLLRESINNKTKLQNTFLDVPMADFYTDLTDLEGVKLSYIKNSLMEYLNNHIDYYTSNDVVKKVITITYLKGMLLPLSITDLNNLKKELPFFLKFIYLIKGEEIYSNTIKMMNNVIKETLNEKKASASIKLILKN